MNNMFKHRAGILALFLLFCGSCYGQSITNGSFEQPPVPVNTWNFGPIPSWQCAGTGSGLWQPNTAYFSALPDGKTVAWMNHSTCSQDLGMPGQPNTTYKFHVPVGHRLDGYTTLFRVDVSANGGIFCSMSGDSAIVPSGTFQEFVIPCPIGNAPTVGNLVLTITALGSQLDLDNITLTSDAPPAPLVIPLPGMVTTFPMNAPPACLLADGTCTFSVRVCLPDGVTCLNSSEGILYLVKTTSNNGEQATVVAKSVKTP